VRESYSIRQLSELSGHSPFKLKCICRYWLSQTPPAMTDYRACGHLVYDGTYFHKDGCLISLMNASDSRIISSIYASKEGANQVLGWFQELKAMGLEPRCITMDGERSVIQAIRSVWPSVRIQRCLWHIQMQGQIWLRSYPKSQAGRDLRKLLGTLCRIRSIRERNRFLQRWRSWLRLYRDSVNALPRTEVAYTDLKRTVRLIHNAIPDMFHYLIDPMAPHTTNSLESFYSRLKHAYRAHRGLNHKHKMQYLQWYCHLESQH
jgi:transposase-like protein